MESPQQHEAVAAAPVTVSEVSPAPYVSHLQRQASPGQLVADELDNRRKLPKISRACDQCKVKKSRCSGTRPCDGCTKRGLPCTYSARYSRGKLPTSHGGHNIIVASPQPSRGDVDMRSAPGDEPGGVSSDRRRIAGISGSINFQRESVTSRESPELEAAEAEGHQFDPAGLTFLHRAWKRFPNLDRQADSANGIAKRQPLMTAGDKIFDVDDEDSMSPVDGFSPRELMGFYFDVCVVTYRFLHNQTVSGWLETVEQNFRQGLPVDHELGHAKAAVVLTILAIASVRQAKVKVYNSGDGPVLRRSDGYFCAANSLTEEETGLPQLESAQARLLQVLYLLQTSRMNQAWYVFGNTVQIISTLGLHRNTSRKQDLASRSTRTDYIHLQCQKRTFWVAYIIDKYLSAVLGRPRQFHDDEIDQDFPDCVNDEDMTPAGPSSSVPLSDCLVDALVFHAKLSRLLGNISGEVYSRKRTPKQDRLAIARRFARELHDWRRKLPPHLGTVRPSSLIPSFRRQATALKLAYSHAIMHANRPFLLTNISSRGGNATFEESVTECISAAQVALEIVDAMSSDGTLFHAFWWTHYVAFCAVSVVYVWQIQQSTNGATSGGPDKLSLRKLLDLADRCQGHFERATPADSPMRRYGIILEELRLEARNLSARNSSADSLRDQLENELRPDSGDSEDHAMRDGDAHAANEAYSNHDVIHGAAMLYGMHNPLDEWQTTDWLELDSSAFDLFRVSGYLSATNA